MKLRNKKTGEILESARSSAVVKDKFRIYDEVNDKYYTYNSLAELNEEWEDYKEPKKYWYISDGGDVYGFSDYYVGSEVEEAHREIGNLFESREEAEKAVRKLEAWKVLKDMDFKIEGIRYRNNKSYIEWSISQKVRDDHFTSEAFNDALHLLFGGEE